MGQVAGQEEIDHKIAEEYAIVGHSQGGQAALFGASMHGGYASPGRLVGVAALAPASNLKGDDLPPFGPAPPAGENGLLRAYRSPTVEDVGDLGGFYVLFTNGVVGGDPRLKDRLGQIFQPEVLAKYDEDYDDKARVELSADSFWMERPPLALDRPRGIFRVQRHLNGDMITEWDWYWDQVEKFTPRVKIPAPIRISQARGDLRVVPDKTEKLLAQLEDIPGQGPITREFRDGDLADPDPHGLGEHFGLLVDPTEVTRLVRWVNGRRARESLPVDGRSS